MPRSRSGAARPARCRTRAVADRRRAIALTVKSRRAQVLLEAGRRDRGRVRPGLVRSAAVRAIADVRRRQDFGTAHGRGAELGRRTVSSPPRLARVGDCVAFHDQVHLAWLAAEPDVAHEPADDRGANTALGKRRRARGQRSDEAPPRGRSHEQGPRVLRHARRIDLQQPHGDPRSREMLLRLRDRELPVVEDRRAQRGIGPSPQCLDEVFELAGAAGGDHGDPDAHR